MLVGQAAPAQAYTCSGWYHAHLDSGVSVLDYNFNPRCSDGLSHLNGTVYDTACDSRQAQGLMVVDTVRGSSSWEAWDASVWVDNGCGNSNTFSKSGPAPVVLSEESWKVHACTWAQNAWGSSSQRCADIHP